MLIDCETCSQREAACADCVVTFLTIPSRPRAVVPATARAADLGAEISGAEISEAESRALSVLAGCGLVPPLRMTPRRTSSRAG